MTQRAMPSSTHRDAPAPISVMICDDHELVATGLSAVLDREPKEDKLEYGTGRAEPRAPDSNGPSGGSGG